MSNDSTDAIRNMTDEFGRVDVAKVSAALAGWGLDSGLHNDWIARDRKLRLVNGQVVRWDGPIADKLAFGLADLEVPATAEKLLAHIGESRAVTSAKNAMAEDERFVRVNEPSGRWLLGASPSTAGSHRLLDRFSKAQTSRCWLTNSSTG